MELHYDKFQLLPVQCDPTVRKPDGSVIIPGTRMEYLGTVLTSDVHDAQEVTRRIAMARRDFLALEVVWKRSALTWKRKLAIFATLVESKLLYSLACIAFTTAQKRQLDGFQNRCLRRIIGVKPAFVSRVSNAAVMDRCTHTPATDLLQRRQLQLLGRVLNAPEGHPLKTASFIPGTLTPATEQYVRRRGRPCIEWVPQALSAAIRLAGSTRAFIELYS